jgi:transcriptional regulator with XRE-family HTH domain
MIPLSTDQIRAARALLRWTAQDLADQSGIGITTIRRLEISRGVPRVQLRTLLKLKEALEAGGIEFIGTPDDRPGVRLSNACEP